MNKQTYEHITQPLRQNPTRAKAVIMLNTSITYVIYVAYPALLVWLFANGWPYAQASDVLSNAAFIKALAVPLVSFVIVSVFRKLYNAPRPYEVFQTAPVMPKNTRGKSFPSRHVFSIFMIATTFLFSPVSPLFGYVILALGVLLAVARVLVGVHFPRDVIAGALLGIGLGIAGFWA